MNEYVEIAVIGAIGVLALLLFKQAFGTNSLEELHNEVSGQDPYRQELVKYIVDHNFTDIDMVSQNKTPRLIAPEDFASFETPFLEDTVKNHMKACVESGNKTVGPNAFGLTGNC